MTNTETLYSVEKFADQTTQEARESFNGSGVKVQSSHPDAILVCEVAHIESDPYFLRVLVFQKNTSGTYQPAYPVSHLYGSFNITCEEEGGFSIQRHSRSIINTRGGLETRTGIEHEGTNVVAILNGVQINVGRLEDLNE